MLAVTQPLRVGDWVFVEDQYGVVEDIRLTYTFLRTPGGQRVVIPNEKLASGILRNDTLGAGVVGARRPASGCRATPTPAARSTCCAEETGQSVTVAETTVRACGSRSAASRARRRTARRARPSCGCGASRRLHAEGLLAAARVGLRRHGRRTQGGVLQSRVRRHESRPAHQAAPSRQRRSAQQGLLALMVLGICVVLAGLGGVGYVVSVAASAPPLSSLKPR